MTTTVKTSSADGGSQSPHLGYIAGLDGIRAISISIVIVAHSGFGHIFPGGLGVTIFFFLSGYLITTLLIKEMVKSNTISLRKFYVRRLLRLSPELLLLILFGGTIGLLYAVVRPADLVAALTYTTNYYVLYDESFGGGTVRWPHIWSLAVEEHFYLTFPLLMLCTGRNLRLLAIILTLLCGTALLWRFLVAGGIFPFPLWGGDDHPYTYIASEARSDSIAYGCLTAILFHYWKESLKSTRSEILLAFLGVTLMLVSLVVRDDYFRQTLRYTFQGIAIALLFVVLFRSSIGPRIIPILEFPLMRRAGILSYGAYLFHLEAMHLYTYSTGIKVAQASFGSRIIVLIGCFVFAFAMAQISLSLTAPVRRLRSRFAA